MKLLLIIGILMMTQGISFKEQQTKFARVKSAYEEKEGVVKQYFEKSHIPYNGFNLYIRIFKREQLVEVWTKPKDNTSFQKITTYDFCTTSGTLGPKRREGDLQIPEGIYHVNHFNPQSNFHLSLGVSYPNASDKILSNKKSPGGAIYIHGNCVTIGCVPITDDKIKELYILAVEAKNNGQKEIPIHIFPSKLDDKFFESAPTTNRGFWSNLRPIYEDFEKTHALKAVKVNSKGEYYF